jgi:hypothetical protein
VLDDLAATGLTKPSTGREPCDLLRLVRLATTTGLSGGPCYSGSGGKPARVLCEESASMPADFDIRKWMRKHGVTLPANDPAVREEIATLLRRDINERLAAYAERSRQNQGRTLRGNSGEPECSDSVSA